MKSYLRVLLAAVAAALVAGCGGGGGSGAAAGGATPSVTSGAITAFGSIVINGRHLRVDGASIGQDGEGLTKDDLELGMMVRVEDDDSGRHVEVEEAVRGPVDAVSDTDLTVMGQLVHTDATTRLHGISALSDLVAGDVVEVGGLRGSGGAIEATSIEKKAAGDTHPYTVTGMVAAHDAGALTFMIGGLTVDYQNARLDDLPGGPGDGMVVEVKDADRTYVAGSRMLLATKVEREHAAGAGAGHKVEVERIVTAVNADGTFVVGDDLLVRPDGARYKLGTAADIAVGVRVEIEGRVLTDGSLQAHEIKFDDKGARLSGIVEAVDAPAGTLQVLGVPVQVADRVRFEDLSGLGDLVAGATFVKVEGRATAAGEVVAFEIARGNPSSDRELRGTASAKDAAGGTLTLLGVPLTVGAGTEYEADDDHGSALTQSAFFDLIRLDATIVKATWDGDGFAGTAMAPKSLEIEDHEDDDHFGDRLDSGSDDGPDDSGHSDD